MGPEEKKIKKNYQNSLWNEIEKLTYKQREKVTFETKDDCN